MKCLLFLFLLINSMILAFGQVAPQTEKVGPITQASQANQEIWKKQQESLLNDSENKLRGLQGQAEGSESSGRVEYLPEPKFTKEQKLLITPANDDLARNNDFLKLPKTGIFKILPNICGDERIINVKDEKCLSKGYRDLSYYSFRKKLYAGLAWSDLNYEDDSLVIGFEKLTIGFIRELGDVPLDSLNKDSAEIKVLIELKMPKELTQIRLKKEEIMLGIDIGENKFFSKVKTKQGQTYLLRSYSYRTRLDAYNDRRIDIVVAFKIIGIDDSKGLTIIWKELFKGDTIKI